MARILTDKVIVITGASSGIGAATARACAQAGMDVVLAARRQDLLAEVAGDIEAAGRRALCVACDVTRDEDVQRLFEQSMAHFGRVDVIFANAGYGRFTTVMEITDAQHRDIFEVNYFGTIRTLQQGVACLRKTPDGLKHVLICSSAASEIGLPFFGAYCATKAAQDSIAGALRAELHHEGIAVTSIHPVGTKTNFFENAREIGNGAGVHANTPDALTQTPQQVARAIVKAIRKPRPEVWTDLIARFGLAVCTFFPRLPSFIMRRHYRKLMREQQQNRQPLQP